MSDTTAYFIVIFIGALAIGGPVLHWRLTGKPMTDESKLLRRIVELEQQVDDLTRRLADEVSRLSANMDEMEKLRQEVRYLRQHNVRLALLLARHVPDVNKLTKSEVNAEEIELLTKQLTERRLKLAKIELKISNYLANQAPLELELQRDAEMKAIADLESRFDVLYELGELP